MTDATATQRLLTETDIRLGEPLPWSVTDQRGQLLLSKGQVVKTEKQLQRLLNQRVLIQSGGGETTGQPAPAPETCSRGAPGVRTKAAKASVFDWVDLHYQCLYELYHELTERPSAALSSRLRKLAESVMRAGSSHHRGILGAIQLAEDKSYSCIKALHVGVLCDQLAKRIKLDPAHRLCLVAAGLVHDLGMWRLQEELQARDAPLTDEQFAQIRRHPEQGVELLRRAGLNVESCLTAVLQHHERLDGSGYSRGLKGEKVAQEARILAIADTYAAMVRPRGDRDKLMPKEALRDIFMARGESIDGTLAQLFIKEIGIFPPGTALKLVSGEIAVAVGPGSNASFPEVEILVDAAGQPLRRSQGRDTSDKQHAIVEIVPLPSEPELGELLKGLWEPMPAELLAL